MRGHEPDHRHAEIILLGDTGYVMSYDHVRPLVPLDDGDVPAQTGGFTVVSLTRRVEIPAGVLGDITTRVQGFARCRKSDVYRKGVGRMIGLARALQLACDVVERLPDEASALASVWARYYDRHPGDVGWITMARELEPLVGVTAGMSGID